VTLAVAQAAEPDISADQMPRVPATEPEQAAKTFVLRPGFTAELVAAEPLIASPVALDVDEQGRAYVVEMRDYSERRPEQLGRIKRLKDTDGDGRYDKATVVLANLPWPTAVTCWRGDLPRALRHLPCAPGRGHSARSGFGIGRGQWRGQAAGLDLRSNREVAPNFTAWAVETEEGETVMGLLVRETDSAVSLKLAGGAEAVFARARVKALRQEARSLMPEGLEAGLNPSDVAGLLAWLTVRPNATPP
jgi:hypothetical protein